MTFVLSRLRPPAHTLHDYDDFYQCARCRHVYGQGRHFTRLSAWVEALKQRVLED